MRLVPAFLMQCLDGLYFLWLLLSKSSAETDAADDLISGIMWPLM